LIREILNSICRAKYYIKLNVIAAFNNIRIAKGHEWKIAFITKFGLFETLVMPFGLCNSLANFQNYINNILWDALDKYVTAYLDDVLIYSESRFNYRKHVREIVKRFMNAGLQINVNKCEFDATKTKYLGLIIRPGGIEMNSEKVKAIITWNSLISLNVTAPASTHSWSRDCWHT
jgi:hypothetical protein